MQYRLFEPIITVAKVESTFQSRSIVLHAPLAMSAFQRKTAEMVMTILDYAI